MAPQPPQAFISSYAPRLRHYNNALLTAAPASSSAGGPASRTTKRNTVVRSYAEDELDEDDIFEDSADRRQSSLRTRREDPNATKIVEKQFGGELTGPVDIQGIWREWMGKLRTVRWVISSLSDVRNGPDA